MATLVSDFQILENNLPPVDTGLTAHSMTIVNNSSVSFSYAAVSPLIIESSVLTVVNQQDGGLLDALFGGLQLSVSEGTFDINATTIEGTGSVVLGDLSSVSSNLTIDVDGDVRIAGGVENIPELTINSGGTIQVGDFPESALEIHIVDTTDLFAIEPLAGGEISTSGATPAGDANLVQVDVAASTANASTNTELIILDPNFGVFDKIGVEVIGDNLFVEGETGIVTEIRISNSGCQICDLTVPDFEFVIGSPLLPSLMVFSGLNLDFDEVLPFLESSDGFLSEGFQNLLLSGNDNIVGTDFDDALAGLGGDDTLEGGGGNDTMIGGEGADVFDGGDGFDFVSYADADGRVFADVANRATARGAAEGDTFTNTEGVIGSRFGDHLRGNESDNILQGGNASDRLFGRDGDDTLEGGRGNDAIYGGRGADIMSGGSGSDRFIFFNELDTLAGQGQRDIITDFSTAEGDKIQISRLDANEFIRFHQDFEFIGTADFTAIGQVRFEQNEAGFTLIQGDNTGDGIADFEIELTGLHDLTTANFFL